MSRLILPFCCLFLALSVIIAQGQLHKLPNAVPRPPAPADARLGSDPDAAKKKRFDNEQVEREARELSDLAKSIPLDVDQINQGLMPKDMVQKLKRIEKLSKHLRMEVAAQ